MKGIEIKWHMAFKNTITHDMSTTIPATYLYDGMRFSKSTQKVLILDSCSSGAIFEDRTFDFQIPMRASQLQQQKINQRSKIRNLKNSVFTHFLLEGLRGAADYDQDGKITIIDLHEHIRRKIKNGRYEQTAPFVITPSTEAIVVAYSLPALNERIPILNDVTLEEFSLYHTQVNSFLGEYLGTKENPVPFGGRDKKLQELDGWLSSKAVPQYLIISEPSGRGKSALIARWFQHLQEIQLPDLFILYFPISIRQQTNTIELVFTFLNERLAWLHKRLDAYKARKSQSAQDPIFLFNELLNKPLPDKKLLVILDGLDEAMGWKPDRRLFPSILKHLRGSC
jgi:hypothetical protein